MKSFWRSEGPRSVILRAALFTGISSRRILKTQHFGEISARLPTLSSIDIICPDFSFWLLLLIDHVHVAFGLPRYSDDAPSCEVREVESSSAAARLRQD
jgi:hypothetical protein